MIRLLAAALHFNQLFLENEISRKILEIIKKRLKLNSKTI